MEELIKKSKKLPWFLYIEKTLFEGKGFYSQVKVTKKGDWISLYTGKKYLQTYFNTQYYLRGNVFDWYLVAPWFSGNFEGSMDSLLILGLGGGSQVKYYNHLYKIKGITGVEIDPLIIDLGKKYFDLNDTNLKIVNMDAYLFLDTTTAKYDLIILDLFKENVFEKNCQSYSFFHKTLSHLNFTGVLLVNRVLGDPSGLEMTKELKKIFKTVITLNLFKSVFYIATNSPTAPKNIDEVTQILSKAGKFKNDLRFLENIKVKNIKMLL